MGARIPRGSDSLERHRLRCGLLSNCFDHLFDMVPRAVYNLKPKHSVSDECYCAQVLNGSRVVQSSRRDPDVHQFSLTTVDTDAVVTWTRRHIGSVTSLTERQMSRTITLPVEQPGSYRQ